MAAKIPIELLIDALVADESIDQITFMAEELGDVTSVTTKDILIALSRHPNAIVREGAIYGMVKQYDNEVEAVLKGMLEDPSPGVREAAREALDE